MNSSVAIQPITQNLHDKLIHTYKQAEKRLKLNYFDSTVSYVSPVNFTESMAKPRHRWFPYKEGFSPSFVENFLNQQKPNPHGIILDPFCGVGTTPIVASSMGFRSFGMDVSPLAIFVSNTKSTDFESEEVQELEDVITMFSVDTLTSKHSAPDNETVISYFEPEYLDALLRIRSFIEKIYNPKIKSLFLLSYLSLIEDFSTHRKAGNGVKRKTRFNYRSTTDTPICNIRANMVKLVTKYLEDIKFEQAPLPPSFSKLSCLEIESFQNITEISGVITSPPYANCFDYSKIYMRELWLGDFFRSKNNQALFRNQSIRSHVHATWEERHPEYADPIIEDIIRPILEGQKLWSNKIPTMLSGYFKDISRLLDLVSRRAIIGAPVGLVVSNSFYGGIPIATDILISRCGERFGLETKSIDVYRGMIPSSQQYKRIEDKYFMRESLVVLIKS